MTVDNAGIFIMTAMLGVFWPHRQVLLFTPPPSPPPYSLIFLHDWLFIANPFSPSPYYCPLTSFYLLLRFSVVLLDLESCFLDIQPRECQQDGHPRRHPTRREYRRRPLLHRL